ncbi:MAG: DUF6898 family protein [Roseiarcus sp.]
MPPDEIIIETQRIGAILRVAAVDVATGTEVTFQAPASASRASINRLAANKLRYVLGKTATSKDERSASCERKGYDAESF